jgi:hypothetical protein
MVVGILLGIISIAHGSDTTQQLQSALHRLESRMGNGEVAESWRRYLLLNVLDTQAAKGEQADIPTLQMIQQRFETNAEGLNHQLFDDVRIALKNQIQMLESSHIGDLNAAVLAARHQFRPITVEIMDKYRRQAEYELLSLKYFYRAELTSQRRSEAFYMLQLDEMVEFLKTVEFELAPEISVGKMNSMIKAVEGKYDAVIKKIDALPVRRPLEGLNPELDLPLEGDPAPDDEPSLDVLIVERDILKARISELTKQRDEVRSNDLPRGRKRAATFRQLLEYENGFTEAAGEFGDPVFVSTRLAYERFVRSYYYGTADNLQEDFLIRIERLIEELPKLDDPSERVAAGNVGSTLEWLENAFQVPQLITTIRARYSYPNAFVSISSNLINTAASRTQSETRPISENVQGRLVRGCATTNSVVAIDLISDPNQAHFSIGARADVTSNTYLQQGKIKVYVNANGQAEARRSILMNVGGLLESAPYGSANVCTSLQGTSSNCGLVKRIVQKKFDEKRAESNVGATNRVRQELMERFSSETEGPIDQAKTSLADAKAKARNRANYVPELYVYSQPDKINVVAKKSSKSTLGAPNLPLQFGFGNDVEVRLNDSIIGNYLHPVFSGKTFTNEELAEELESLTGTKPGALAAGADANAVDESFSITFANVKPIMFEFEQNGFTVLVSGTRFSQGDKRINAGLRIKLSFRIVQHDGELQLVRNGKAEIDYLDSESKDAKIVGFKSFLEGRLNPRDGDQFEPVNLPANLLPIDKIEALKDRPIAQRLQLSQCRSEGGWMYLGWNYVSEGGYSTQPADLPAIWTNATIEQMDSTYTPTLEPEIN